MSDAVKAAPGKRKRNACLMACVAVVWLAIDLATKAFFDSGAYTVGQDVAGPFLGLFKFTLVHNTGAAWGLFAGNTWALGVFSLVVCVVLVVYLMAFNPNAKVGEAVALGLVLAGGLGNAYDRFFTGYVVDFINVTFMDFPVFNIADIGVTCGIVAFFVFVIFFDFKEDAAKEQMPEAPSPESGD